MARFPTTAAALRTVVNADNALAASHLDTLSGTTASADELNLLDGLSAAGNATADAVGEWVRLLCVKAGQWQVIGYAGTWAHEG
jgi:hypothetical protein